MQELLIPTKIIHSNRKSIALVIECNGDFIVRAPLKSSDKQIFDFINQKRDWIIKKRVEQINNQQKPINLQENSSISILGKEHLIQLTNNARVKVADSIIYLPATNSKEKLIQYLKKLAKTTITSRVNNTCVKFKFNYSSISINSAKTRWGSCTPSNKLHFTYKLMLCPIPIVDYIIIHELCHTKVKNHSKKFWQLVEYYYPDYITCEKWLKKNRAIIEFI